MSRWLLYQQTQRLVASSTSPSRSNGPLRNGDPVRVHSVLYSPMVVSARALSNASPTLPIEGRIPCSSTASVKWIEVYWLPASEWWIVLPDSRCPCRARVCAACAIVRVTNVVALDIEHCQPTIVPA